MLKCPPLGITKENRYKEIVSSCDKWVSSKEMQELVGLFGGNPVVLAESAFSVKLDYLYEFAKIWDFRKGKERWTITDEQMQETCREKIWRCAERLGLRGVALPETKPDYVFVLGGARLSNLHRTLMAYKVMNKLALSGKTFVALSAFRPLNELEIPFVKRYAPDAHTEYEALRWAMRDVFSLEVIDERITEEENVNLTTAYCTFSNDICENSFYILAAPSSAPTERRANTLDTYHYCYNMLSIPKGSRVMIVTSDIYVPFQLVRFMPFAIEKEVYADFIGTQEIEKENNEPAPANAYLQEIKATIDAMHDICRK